VAVFHAQSARSLNNTDPYNQEPEGDKRDPWYRDDLELIRYSDIVIDSALSQY
jgi:hypothetical protein